MKISTDVFMFVYICLCNVGCSPKQNYARSCSLFPTELPNSNCEFSFAEQLQLRYHITSQLQLRDQLHPTSSQQLQMMVSGRHNCNCDYNCIHLPHNCIQLQLYAFQTTDPSLDINMCER